MLLGSIISEVSCFNGYGHLSFETKLEASCNFKGFFISFVSCLIYCLVLP